jgi:outer membrane protein OmpA-like peptidoglycan-associated protein/ABC-type nitrate/sulfonate/bicarbonate transport system substrate-binding protein
MMKTSTKVILILFVLGIVGIVGYKFLRPILQDRAAAKASDAVATKGKLAIRYDSWPGYYPLYGLRMKKEMRTQGYVLDGADDGADMEKRMKMLASGEIQFAVATVDAYLLAGAPQKFPGRIITVVDESKGGDAIVAWKDTVPNLEALKAVPVGDPTGGFQRPPWKIAYTPNSPSHHLLKATASHFGIKGIHKLDKSRKVETKESKEALKVLLDRKVDVAVLWEPDVSKAIASKDIVKILGTENTSRLIVDVLLVNVDFAQKNPEAVSVFLKTYFRVLKHYNDHPENLKKEMRDELKLEAGIVEKMIQGVSWVNLSDNCQEWFGMKVAGRAGQLGIIDTIESAIDILRDSGDFSANPLPGGDPYRITQKSFIEEIYKKGIETGFKSIEGDAGSPKQGIDKPFSALTEAQWNALREVGTLKVEPIKFQSGTSDILLEGKELIDKMVASLKSYPTFRILVKGHTAVSGDAEANLTLSLERAEAVARYLKVTHGIDENRIRFVGFGGTKPLPREAKESNREYEDRSRRVEVSLLTQVY